MRRLSKNRWRTGWILSLNSAIIVLLFTAPIYEYHNEGQIFHAMGTAQPPFSFWAAIFANVWTPVFLGAMALGILAEMRRSIFSPILNLLPFAALLVWAAADWVRSRGSYEGERSLGLLVILPACLVVLVNAISYWGDLSKST
jgi:hypothetical protein